ncbi:MAG TPA: choice-of-anchor D domain-containing protein [Candidatus Kapabacteria bacterium]|nr:choice-of-anchor D domain-containing protein [Candidatus Kapabacteria bacterium]
MKSMNTWNRLSIAGMCLLFLSIFTSQAAAVTDTLLSETFASGLPGTWSDDGSWFSSSNGYGGSNGSMYCDMYDYYTTSDYLTAPTVDASNYAADADSVWVDFDFSWQYNNNDADYGDDYFYVSTDYDNLMSGSTSGLATYSTGDYTVNTDPPTDASYWQHYHLLVPVSSRTSSLNIYFMGSPYWGSSDPAIDNVSITAVSIPDTGTKLMSLSRNSIALGKVRVGSQNSDTLIVTSDGTGTLRINSSMQSGAPFSSSPTSSNRSVTAGSNETDYAIFSPSSRGMFEDSIIFTTNSDSVAEQRMTVYVSGQGIKAIFDTTNGTSLPFGNLRVGQTTQKTFYFSNSGDDTLFLQPSTESSGFSVVSGSSSLTIPPGQADSVIMQFAPVAWQSYSGTLSFAASNGVTTPSITLSGVGLQSQIEVSNSTAFGVERVGQTLQGMVTFNNTGNDTLNISGASLVQPSSLFALGAYNQVVAPGASGVIHVAYSPAQRGLDSATLLFTTDDPVHPSETIVLTGQGIQAIFSPTNGIAVAFGHVRIRETAQQTFAFSNIGDDTLFLQPPTIPDAGFSVVSASLVLPPNQTGNVVVQFAPTLAQQYNGTMLLTALNGVAAPSVALSGRGSAPHIQVANAMDFGPMRVGLTLQSTITFTNTAAYDTLHLSNGLFTQPSTRFTLGAYDQAVPPGATGTIHLAYSPNLAQTDNAQLHFITDDPTDSAFTINVTGTGELPKMFVVNNNQTIDLGQVKVNSSTTHDFAVANNGGWDLNLSSATATPAPFSVTGKPNAIAWSTIGYVTVTFAPTSTGRFTGTLVIAGDDPSNPSSTIYLTGTGIESALSVNPNVNFGAVPVASTVMDTIVLTNSGGANVNINSYTFTPTAGAFAIVGTPATQVSAGGTASVIISFHPDAAQSYAGTLTLSTDDAGTPTRTVNLSGIGVKSALSVASSIDFGNVMIGQDSTIHASIKNTGQASVTINSLTMTGSAFSNGTFATPLTIGIGQTVNLDLTFTPTLAGAATGSVRATLGDNSLVSIALTGDGVDAAGVTETGAGNEFSLSISPNPANRIATAHISMMNAADGQLTVFDVTGHEVLSLPLGLLSEGAHDVSLPIEHLASGSYFVRITNTSGESAAARLVLAR